jgi:hypothetical protein
MEHRLRVFENRVLRRIFGPKRKWREAGEDYIMRSLITCMFHQILLGQAGRQAGRPCDKLGRGKERMQNIGRKI